MVKTPLSRALCVCTAVCCGVVLLPTLSVQAQEDEALKAHRQMLPARCGAAAKACVPLVVHVVVDVEGRAVQTPDWMAHHLREANRHFAPLGVEFAVVQLAALPAKATIVATRADRDRLGRGRWRRGQIAVFVVGQLDNVDEPGEIRGVHWRERARRSRRWVILSAIAPSMVLAHELGHFYGLPHSSYPVSIMNKKPRRDPPLEARTFAPPEIALMRRRLKAMRRSGVIQTLDP
ncbi:MAG: matrixin family metalloprotease [Myxococcota bacterium]